TIEAWANPASTNSDGAGVAVVSSINPDFSIDGNNRAGFLIYARGNPNNWQFRIGSEHLSYISTISGGHWSVGNWNHVVGVYDGSKTYLYVDGVLVVGPSTPSGPFQPNPNRPFRISGTSFSGNLGSAAGNRGWDGWIDEVAMYNYALSASTIKAHFDARSTNNIGYHSQILADNPVGYWPLDDQPTAYYDTEMLALDISGGSLPPGLRLRESPTLASPGQVAIQPQLDGTYKIDGYFCVWLDLSADFGTTWWPGTNYHLVKHVCATPPTNNWLPAKGCYYSNVYGG